MLKDFLQIRYQALREALACVGLGLRDTRHAGLWWRSALCSIAVVFLWLWLYYRFAGFFQELSMATAIVGIGGLLGLGVLDLGRGMASGPATLSNMGSVVDVRALGGMAQTLLSIVQVALVLLALVAFVYVLIFVVGMLSTARVAAPWVCLRGAREVVARRYAGWQPAAVEVATPNRLRQALSLLALLIPVWAAVLLLRALIAWNVRFMYPAAAEGLLDAEQQRRLAAAQGPAIFMLGLLLVLMMLVPFLNLLAPAAVCTSVCHLQRRGWVKPMRAHR